MKVLAIWCHIFENQYLFDFFWNPNFCKTFEKTISVWLLKPKFLFDVWKHNFCLPFENTISVWRLKTQFLFAVWKNNFCLTFENTISAWRLKPNFCKTFENPISVCRLKKQFLFDVWKHNFCVMFLDKAARWWNTETDHELHESGCRILSFLHWTQIVNITLPLRTQTILPTIFESA